MKPISVKDHLPPFGKPVLVRHVMDDLPPRWYQVVRVAMPEGFEHHGESIWKYDDEVTGSFCIPLEHVTHWCEPPVVEAE